MSDFTREAFEELVGFELENWQWDKINVGDRYVDDLPVTAKGKVIGKVTELRKDERGIEITGVIFDEFKDFVEGPKESYSIAEPQLSDFYNI